MPTTRNHSLELLFRLKGIPLFAEPSAEQLLPVADIAKPVRFAAGDAIVEEGTVGEHMYLITDGRVEVRSGDHRLAELGPGECFGEMAVLDRSVRSATVAALVDTAVLATAREDLQDLLDLYPALAQAIMNVLAARLRAAIESESDEDLPPPSIA